MTDDSIARINNGEWKWSINPDKGKFDFSCSLCGCCCRGDMTISLNLEDLQHMAVFLEFETCGRLFKEGYVREIPLAEGGFRPAIQFRSYPSQFCPFLENRLDDDWKLTGLCRLHPKLKPLVCHLAPVGREVVFDEQYRSQESWVFTEPVEGCPGCRVKNTQVAKDYIETHEASLELEKDYFKVMTHLQRSGASYGDFQRFHYQLEPRGDLRTYIDNWMPKI